VEKQKVLIFPAGTEIAFEIFNALKYIRFVEVWGATSASDHSEFVYERLIKGLPFITDSDFITNFNKILIENKIDYVYPAHDDVQLFLTLHKNELSAKIVTSDEETVRICRSKEATYRYLQGESFIPKVYTADNIDHFPIYAKPSVGQGAQGARLISNKEDLKYALSTSSKELVLCEYLPGMEYTVDCFTDRHEVLRAVHIRDRSRIRTGISVRSSLLPLPEEIEKIALKLNQKFHFNGAWFFQVKKDTEGKYKLLEISARIPGTMGVTRNIGLNYPLLTLYNMWGYDVDIFTNDYTITVDRAFQNAYKINIEYDRVYVDLDDTLIINGNVNLLLIRLLYQCVNKGIKVILLTKHAKNPLETLSLYKIADGLFDEIIHLDKNADKYKYVKGENPIFIDDSFAERKEIKEHCGIPVFGLDMVECLIDWRM